MGNIPAVIPEDMERQAVEIAVDGRLREVKFVRMNKRAKVPAPLPDIRQDVTTQKIPLVPPAAQLPMEARNKGMGVVPETARQSGAKR